MRKRGQGSDLSYTEEKNGNNTLVTIKRKKSLKSKRFTWTEKAALNSCTCRVWSIHPAIFSFSIHVFIFAAVLSGLAAAQP